MKQKELLSVIDFNKLSETTLELCKESKFIPSEFVTEAALALCSKLRKELDDTKTLLKSYEKSKISAYKDPIETNRYLSCKFKIDSLKHSNILIK